MILSVLLLAGGCKKDDNVEISSEGKITGKINGVDIGPSTIFSDIQTSGSSQVMYITAKTDFESFSKPSTNGKQLLVRIQPYTGIGKYTTTAQGFWVYSTNIKVVDASTGSWTTHRYSDTEKTGSMNLEITSDKTENGKRVIRGKFSGESGVTLKISNFDQKEVPLEAFKLSDINFVAPAKE